MKSTTATLASRNLAARRRLGLAAPTTQQAATLASRTTHPDPVDHSLVASTQHGTGRYCQHVACPAPSATLSTYNGGRHHYGCRLAALEATGQHAGDASL